MDAISVRNRNIVSNMDMMDELMTHFKNDPLFEELQLDDEQEEGILRIMMNFKCSLNKRAPMPVVVVTESAPPSRATHNQVTIAEPSSSRKRAKAEKSGKAPGLVSNYVMYMKERMPELKKTSTEETCVLMKAIAAEWREMDEEQREVYGVLAHAFQSYVDVNLRDGSPLSEIKKAWKLLSREDKMRYAVPAPSAPSVEEDGDDDS